MGMQSYFNTRAPDYQFGYDWMNPTGGTYTPSYQDPLAEDLARTYGEMVGGRSKRRSQANSCTGYLRRGRGRRTTAQPCQDACAPEARYYGFRKFCWRHVRRKAWTGNKRCAQQSLPGTFRCWDSRGRILSEYMA
jgi:hypothetical protein